jgi:Uma2 family endonuclease
MVMAIRSRPLTIDDLQRMRDASNDRLELIEGELLVTPAPTPLHQDIAGSLYTLFRSVVFESGRGRVYFAPLDVRFAENTVVQPDLIVVLSDRPILTEARVEGAPSLAVEIISPSTVDHDRVAKRDLYARYGVPEYWLVDPEKATITIFSDPQRGHYRTEQTTSDVAISATIPGLSADLKALFAPVPGL